MPAIPLDPSDAIELAELLQFLSEWLDPTAPPSPRSWPGSSAAMPKASARCTTTSPGSGFLLGITGGPGKRARQHGRFGTRSGTRPPSPSARPCPRTNGGRHGPVVDTPAGPGGTDG